MKNNFFLAAIAFSLSITGCDLFKKKDTNKITLTAEQKANKEELSYIFGSLLFGIDESDMTSEAVATYSVFYESYCFDAAYHNVDAKKISKYITNIPNVEEDGFLTIFDYASEIKADEGLDDVIYFSINICKALVNISAQSSLELSQTLVSFIKLINEEEDNLFANLYSLLDGAISIYNKVTAPSLLSKIKNIVDEYRRINVTNYQYVVETIGSLLHEYNYLGTNVKYFANFAKKVFNNFSALFEGDDQIIVDLVRLIDFDKIIEEIFENIDKVALKLINLGNDYYTYLDSIQNPFEGYCYAALGALEIIKDEFVLSDEDIVDDVDDLISFVKQVKTIVEKYVDVPEFVTTIINSVNTKDTLVKIISLVNNIINIDLESINAKTLAPVAAIILELSIPSKANVMENFVGIENVPNEFLTLQPIIDYQNAVENTTPFQYDGSFYSHDDPIYDENTDYWSFEYTSIYISIYYDPGFQMDYLSFNYYKGTESIRSLKKIIELLYNVFDEISSKEEITDEIINELVSIYLSAYDLFAQIDDNFEIETSVYQLLAIINDNIEDNSQLLKKISNDLFVVLRNLLSSFIDVGEIEADIDFTKFIILLSFDELKMPFNLFNESRLDGLKPLLEDIYTLFDSIQCSEILLDLVSNFIDVGQIDSATDFANAIYAFAEAIFVKAQ